MAALDTLKTLDDWGIPETCPLLIAGPCSAESRDQVLATAAALQDAGVSLFRAGVWKPRTRPGSFEGHGEKALPWLAEVRERFSFRVGAEVGNAKHVESALQHKLDFVWIGARTTPNPFAVQEIAQALAGTDIPVFVKNPVSPDLGLWQGALERFAAVGLTRIGAIHRGFSSSEARGYRNAPLWRIPIEFKRCFPQVPMICDPSHIGGRRDLIYPIAQEALDILYHGLMIEVHPAPDNALSDAGQQLTPAAFRGVVQRLKMHRELSDDLDYQQRMTELRERIDVVDRNLIKIIRERLDIVQAMGECKRRSNVTALQPGRWEEVLKTRAAIAAELGLPEEFIREIYELIHEEAILWQEKPIFKDLPNPL